VVVIRQAGESGQLYGSVTGRDIAQGVTEAGFTIGRGQVVLEKAIKTLGLYKQRVVLHPEVSVTVTINVAQSLAAAAMSRAICASSCLNAARQRAPMRFSSFVVSVPSNAGLENFHAK
jgi:large subunit ribosomal protein L9